jgi:histone acetyltransferase (RNA polymerase elongator complex component)
MPKGKHKNIPIFIPHMGCPHACVFCDQRTISGQATFDEGVVQSEIETALATLAPDAQTEIAYFGGSFTAIDRSLMIRLLDLAQSFVDAGRVAGIRFSTRPDAVGEDVLDILSNYTISAIELGLQSMDDEVLLASHRGHTAAQAEDACRRIVARGYSLVGQMMLGLPASTPDKERKTAELICSLGAGAVRIYPTVVLEGTALAVMMRQGAYTPLMVDEAIERAADVLAIMQAHNVDVLRVGLCASEGLSGERAVGGANHPALGELAYSVLFGRRMREALARSKADLRGKNVTFLVPRGKTSQAVGQHRRNATDLCRAFDLAGVRICECEGLTGTEVLLKDEN